MGRLAWDEIGTRYFETGVKKSVLYPMVNGAYPNGFAWNGLTAVNESSSGAEPTPLYADNIKYLNLMSAEEFKATIEAYTYPDEFGSCLGERNLARGVIFGQQRRQHFGFCYRTLCGNDKDGTDGGYKLHLIFDCVASPSDRSYSTINDSPEAMTYSWEITTNPEEVASYRLEYEAALSGYKPTAVVTLESNRFKAAGAMNVLRRLEDILYEGDVFFGDKPTMPKISTILSVYDMGIYLRDNDYDALLDSSGHKIQSFVSE